MKKAIIISVLLTALTTVNSSGKIWRVNNTGIPADFTTIQAAHDAATVMAGDTLQIEPSSVSYGTLTSTKKLIIIGPGYFLNENPNQQANPTTAISGKLVLNSGSGGSVITGLTLAHTDYPHEINTGNITLSRNYFSDSDITLSASSSFSDVIISGNFGIRVIRSGSGLSLIINVFILNNVMSGSNFNIQFSGTLANNVIRSSAMSISNFIIKNNICTDRQSQAVFVGSNNTISNNISAANNGLPTGNGNLNGVDMSTVFVGASENSTDGQYQLKTGSPAIGAGLSGEDCGIFGGNTPYHLSGLPATPSIYLLSAPTNSNGPSLPVTISVKTNK